MIFFVSRSTIYNELFSLVTMNIFLVKSFISIPAGEIFSGHFFPSLILSTNSNFLLSKENFNIQLSLPPLAYKYFSSALNFNPYHDLGTITLSRIFSVTGLISWILCTLCPLLVTAIHFFDFETAIFNGRSPNGNERPAGDKVQPFGNVAFFG